MLGRASLPRPGAVELAGHGQAGSADERRNPWPRWGACTARRLPGRHTHWDRDWYALFQTFRLRLVELLDEPNESFAHFLLDGRLAVVDD